MRRLGNNDSPSSHGKDIKSLGGMTRDEIERRILEAIVLERDRLEPRLIEIEDAAKDAGFKITSGLERVMNKIEEGHRETLRMHRTNVEQHKLQQQASDKGFSEIRLRLDGVEKQTVNFSQKEKALDFWHNVYTIAYVLKDIPKVLKSPILWAIIGIMGAGGAIITPIELWWNRHHPSPTLQIIKDTVTATPKAGE